MSAETQIVFRMSQDLAWELRRMSVERRLSRNAFLVQLIERELEQERRATAPPAPIPIPEAPRNGSQPLVAPSRGTRMAKDWAASRSDLAFAAELGLDPEATEAHFRDYWLARADSYAVKRDWSATWRNWCRKAASGPRARAAGPGPSRAAQARRRIVEDTLDFIDAGPDPRKP